MPGFAALETIPADLWWNRSCDCSDPTGQHSTASLDRTVADDASTSGISEHSTAGPITASLEDLSASAYPLSPNSHPGFDTLDRALAGNVSTTGKCVPFATGKFFRDVRGIFRDHVWSSISVERNLADDMPTTGINGLTSTGHYHSTANSLTTNAYFGRVVASSSASESCRASCGLLQRLGVLQRLGSVVSSSASPEPPATTGPPEDARPLAGGPSGHYVDAGAGCDNHNGWIHGGLLTL